MNMLIKNGGWNGLVVFILFAEKNLVYRYDSDGRLPVGQ